jgi:hypothetical protein
LRFLDEPVQKHHASITNAEQHARDAAIRYVAANLLQPPAEWSAQRHSDGPGELYILDVLADDLAIVIAERLEPFASWLSAGRQLIEGGRQSLHGLS